MTEPEWLACRDPGPMLAALRQRSVDRPRMRLFACACCRRLWDLLHPDDRDSLAIIERFARGSAADTLRRAREARSASTRRHSSAYARAVGEHAWDSPERLTAWATSLASSSVWQAGKRTHAAAAGCYGEAAEAAACVRVAATIGPGPERHSNELVKAAKKAEYVTLAAMLRDIVGNPFAAPSALDPAWLAWAGGVVARLAEAARGGDPAAYPVLADALEDAGCRDDALVAHLREPGPHGRECWAIDLIWASNEPSFHAASPAVPSGRFVN